MTSGMGSASRALGAIADNESRDATSCKFLRNGSDETRRVLQRDELEQRLGFTDTRIWKGCLLYTVSPLEIR
jgi:hypothetical protein